MVLKRGLERVGRFENAMKTQTRKKLIEKGRIRFIVNYADGFALLDFYMAFGATAY